MKVVQPIPQSVYRNIAILHPSGQIDEIEGRGEKKEEEEEKTFETRQISRGSLQLGVHDAR